jgi:hypothetical protein
MIPKEREHFMQRRLCQLYIQDKNAFYTLCVTAGSAPTNQRVAHDQM